MHIMCIKNFYTDKIKVLVSVAIISQSRSNQSGLSGHGQTTLSQGIKQNPILQKASNKQGSRVIFGLAIL